MTFYSDKEWRRIGGRRLEFSLPLQSFVDCVLENMPRQYAPWVAAGEDLLLPENPPGTRHRARGARNTAQLFCYPFEQLGKALDETPGNASYARSTVFIGSLKLTPELLGPPQQGAILAWLVMAGLPGVEASKSPESGQWHVGGFFAVERILHVPTSTVHVQAEYAEIQRLLRNALRRASRSRS